MVLLATPPVFATEEQWRTELQSAVPGLEIRFMPDVGDPDEIEVLLVGQAALDELPPLPNLKFMVSVYAGVDSLIRHPRLPKAPIVRAQAPEGDPAMTEYVLLHVLRHHRQLPAYSLQQQERRWRPLPQKHAFERRVGFLGYGALAKPCARMLLSMGFDVAAWVRGEAREAEIPLYYGTEGMEPFLRRTEIAVCLLPLTEATQNLLCARTFAMMPKGSALINVGRGEHVVAEDLLAALDEGRLAAATVDVTTPEPLPPDSPLWRHPRLTILPHVARSSGVPISRLVPQIAENIRRARAGEPLSGVVDIGAGY